MEDVYFKYGLVIVAVAVIIMLMIWSYSALNETTIIPEEPDQSFSGTSEKLTVRITQLCASCTAEENYDQQCYIIRAELTDDVDYMGITLVPGSHILRISNKDGECKLENL